jgi:nucleoside-diphosphate-sugar epimerase
MKILITGASGFIGSNLLNAPFLRGHDLICCRSRVESVPRLPVPDNLHWYSGGLESFPLAALENVDVIVHLAAHSANVPYDSLENCVQNNAMRPLAFLRNAVSAGVKKIIVAGTCFEYGLSADKFERLSPEVALEPVGSYPTSKAIASILFQSMARQSGVQMLILRLFQVYGEGEAAGRFWPSLKQAALSGKDFAMSAGTQVRDFVPVQEVVAAFGRALETEVAPGSPRILHVATGKPQSLKHFALEQWERFGAKGRLLFDVLPMRTDEVMRIVSCPSCVI